ncbi:MAG: endonuclease V [Desulfurobacteriaceae bacterium]
MKFNFSKAKKAQEVLSRKVELTPLKGDVRLVAGCDLTFINPFKTPTLGIGAFVLLSYPELKVVKKIYSTMEIKIPYVPGFLAFREIPLLLKTFKLLGETPDIVIVDGHGIAHPRKLGIAAHFGVVTGIPTIGCAKKPLFGSFKEPCGERGCREPIFHPETGKVIGYALRTKKGVKPVYVSPGHRITVSESAEIVLNLSKKYRLPEPTRLAHNYLQHVRKCIISRNS